MSISKPSVRQQLLAQLTTGSKDLTSLHFATRLDEGVIALGLTSLERTGRVRRIGSLWQLTYRVPPAPRVSLAPGVREASARCGWTVGL